MKSHSASEVNWPHMSGETLYSTKQFTTMDFHYLVSLSQSSYANSDDLFSLLSIKCRQKSEISWFIFFCIATHRQQYQQSYRHIFLNKVTIWKYSAIYCRIALKMQYKIILSSEGIILSSDSIMLSIEESNPRLKQKDRQCFSRCN